jgi:hypothetical protein
MFHRTRDAIEAHLTIVFTALAVAHCIQERSGRAIAKREKSNWWKRPSKRSK